MPNPTPPGGAGGGAPCRLGGLGGGREPSPQKGVQGEPPGGSPGGSAPWSGGPGGEATRAPLKKLPTKNCFALKKLTKSDLEKWGTLKSSQTFSLKNCVILLPPRAPDWHRKSRVM